MRQLRAAGLALILGSVATGPAPLAAQFTTGFDEAAAPCFFGSTTPLTTAYAASGVNFSGGSILDQCSNFAVPTAFSGANFLALNGALTPVTQYMYFDNAWGAFSIQVGSASAAVFQFFLNGNLQLDTGSLAFTRSSWNLYNNSSVTFDEVRITTQDIQEWMILDDLAVRDGSPSETVPEPATMSLLATGLAGIAGARRRRRNG